MFKNYIRDAQRFSGVQDISKQDLSKPVYVEGKKALTVDISEMKAIAQKLSKPS